jgi:hypothetical protein
MKPSKFKIQNAFFCFLGLVLCFPLFIEQAFGLDEIFDTYSSPQCMAQGNACTASASGYLANFYNPAGLTRFNKKTWEAHLVVVEGNLGAGAASLSANELTFGTYRILPVMQNYAGIYTYFNFATVPSITFRNFSFSLLGNYQFAALSNGVQLDIDTRRDIAPTVGFARHFAGNLLKLGIAGKAILRNQMKGVYDHSLLNTMNENTFPSLFKEGLGFGIDSGLLLTLPHQFLPTFGLVWNDMFGTKFSATQYLNKSASGNPDSIPQSFHFGFSINPVFSRSFKSTISVDYRHIELASLPWRKHLHVGLELESQKSLLFWMGLNQLYLTAGLGLRVKGGNLEMGTYAKEIFSGLQTEYDRRFFFRYTISF